MYIHITHIAFSIENFKKKLYATNLYSNLIVKNRVIKKVYILTDKKFYNRKYGTL